MNTVTVLHPGSMGAAVAAQAVGARRVLWVSVGRSSATAQRAHDAGLTACASLEEALGASDAVLSICPPHAAEDVATEVARHAFEGLYVDANAISPQRMDRTRRVDSSSGSACRLTTLEMVVVGATL